MKVLACVCALPPEDPNANAWWSRPAPAVRRRTAVAAVPVVGIERVEEEPRLRLAAVMVAILVTCYVVMK